MFLEGCVIKKTISLIFLTCSFMAGQDMIQVKLKSGSTVSGEFIGTYMEHIHLLIGENINYFKCDDIQSITKSHIYSFDYDCSKNTVTADILFPPQLNPMTGEWETIIPEPFYPIKRNLLEKKEEKKLATLEKPILETKTAQENPLEKPILEARKVLEDQLEKTKNTFQGVITPKLKSVLTNTSTEDFEPKKINLNVEESYNDKIGTNEKSLSLSGTTRIPSTSHLSEDEIRKMIKKEVRKEIQRVLPYEIRKNKEENRSRLFQNILLGCGAWFLFMMMLS